ncbi:hypothetical protein C0995_010148 [Termitomyces sp. Mi166|nr:hypothetical protein C0995_010148 [Termitomyces sp. Mi166\
MPLADFSLSPQMAPKILLLHVSPDASLLERKLAAQKFIVAADAVFLKAQGLATLAPLHKTAFGLLEGLLDDWRQLNLMTIEWLRKAEVHQACVNIWSLNKQAPWASEFRKMVGKGKAKAMEDDDDDEETAQKLRKELEEFVVPTTHVKLVQVAKAFLEQQGKPSQFFILEGYKGKGKAKALVEDSETTGAKQSFKLRELVDSNSDEEEEEDRVCTIKKIKHEHIEELTGIKRRKENMELDDEVEIVAAKIPAAGPSKENMELDDEVEIIVAEIPAAGPLRPSSKPIVLVPGASKFVPKLIVTLASPLAGPSTAPIASSSAPKPAAAAALSKPVPAKSVSPAVKGGSVFKDPFMVRRFKLAGTEESGALIINQATEVPVTQGTLHSDESGDEDAQGDDDDSDGGDVAMNVNSAKQPEETWPVMLKRTVTEVKMSAPGLAPALVTDKTEEDSLLQITVYR